MGLTGFNARRRQLSKEVAVETKDIEVMKLAELKLYAKEIGCDIENTKNHAQAKKIVKDFLAQQEVEQNKAPETDVQGDQPSNLTDEGQNDQNSDTEVVEADANETQDEGDKE